MKIVEGEESSGQRLLAGIVYKKGFGFRKNITKGGSLIDINSDP